MYLSKQSSVQEQRLKVQRLSIPFKIIGNATAADVSISSDSPDVLKIQTAGVDQITSALTAAGDSVTFNTAANDDVGDAGTSSVFRVYLNLGEQCQKLVSARIENISGDSLSYSLKRGDADGLSSLGRPVLVVTAGDSIDAANTLDATLHVDYIGE